jgi:hypothetical protein
MKKEKQKTYSEDHVLAMFEEIKSQGNIVIEQYASLTEKVDFILEDIDILKADNMEMKRDIKIIKADIVEIKEEMVEMNGKLDNKTEKKVSDNHEKRIFKLEKATFATQ